MKMPNTPEWIAIELYSHGVEFLDPVDVVLIFTSTPEQDISALIPHI